VGVIQLKLVDGAHKLDRALSSGII
jgi:hypothetical protein